MKFKAVEKINPNNREAQKKFYATIVLDGEFTLDEMSQEIVGFTSLSAADVAAVLIAIQTVSQKKLGEGKIVRLGKLGSLYPTLSSEGVSEEKEVSVKIIKSVGVNYRAGEELIDAMGKAPKHKV